MGVGIQNETNALFRQEEYYTEYDFSLFLNTSAGRIHVEDFEEEPFLEMPTVSQQRLIYEINELLLDEQQEQEALILRIYTNFQEGQAIAANSQDDQGFQSGQNSIELISDDHESFLDKDPFFRIDADVQDSAIKNCYETDEE